MNLIKNYSAPNIMIFMTDSADHISGKTGLTLTITLSKNGGVFSAVTPTVTERGNGWYALALTNAHTDVNGDLALHITAAGADPTDVVYQIYYHDFDSINNNLTEATIWGYNNRTLTYSPQNLLSINGDGLSVIRGDTGSFVFNPVDFTDYPNYYKSYFTIKKFYQDCDTDAIVQVDSTKGLVVLNGQTISGNSSSQASLTAGSSSGSVVYTSGSITLIMAANITKQFPYSADAYYYDLQIIETGSIVNTPFLGEANIIRDVTKKVT
jgi:hypothetical protein